MTNARIIGIDPGSRITGYGIVEKHNDRLIRIASGVIKTNSSDELINRLMVIKCGLDEIISEFKPTSAAVESVFVSINPRSSLMLGHVRGALLVTLASSGVSVTDYSPKQIKTAVVGYGNADKQQVNSMVTMLLNEKRKFSEDEADAVAAAICHIHSSSSNQLLINSN